MCFGNRLKLLRDELNLSREELANILNITYSALSKYETNARFPQDEGLLKKIADFFDVSVDYLLGRTDIKDVGIIEGNDIPKELKEIGIDYMEVHKTLKEKGLTPREVIELIEDLDKIGLLEKYQKK